MSKLMRYPSLVVAAILAAGVPTSTVAADAKTARELAQARLEIARKVYEDLDEDLKAPPAGNLEEQQRRFREVIDQKMIWSGRWMEAEIDAGSRQVDRTTAIEAHIKRLKKWEDLLVQLAKGGAMGVSQRNVDTLKYHRLNAAYLLAKAKS
jgi:hypothetical protein